MGIGMVLVVEKDLAPALVQRLNQAGEMSAVIGEIQKGPHDVQIV
jgi:phosphoribosylaminoimidazole (AIR) synthetase